MTPNHIRTIRKEAGLSQTGLAAILRIKDLRTIRRWEKGEIPITGPASIILELIEDDALPYNYFHAAGVKVPGVLERATQTGGLASGSPTHSR